MTTYIKEVLIRLNAIPVAGSDVVLEVPEGTEIGALISIAFSDVDGNPLALVTQYSRVGQYITISAPSGIGYVGVVMRIEQSSDFQDDSVGIQEVLISATNTVPAGTNASVSADNSEKGKAKLTFNIPQGNKGESGKSAYELAVAGGFVGTESEWVASLKGNKGDKGDVGSSAYQVALSNGFVGTEAEWVASLKGNKGDKGDAAIGGSRYDEIAGGTFWWIRPRYTVKPNDINLPDLTRIDGVELNTNFVVENTLYQDNGVYIPSKSSFSDATYHYQAIRVVPSNPQPFSVESTGKITGDFWGSTPLQTKNFKGAYYVEVDPAVVVEKGITKDNLHLLEVEVMHTQAEGYEVKYNATTKISIESGKSKGLVIPIYLGAMKDPNTGRLYLLFRPVTYAKRRNPSSVEDVMEWDGIGTNSGEDGGWLLTDPDVRWWSTNVAQGFRFVAKIRTR